MCTGGRGQKDESIGQLKKQVGPTNWQMGLDVNYCFPQYLITPSVYGGKTTLHTQYVFSHRPTCDVSTFYKPTALQNEVQNLNIQKSGYYVTISFNPQFVPFMCFFFFFLYYFPFNSIEILFSQKYHEVIELFAIFHFEN